MWNHCLIFLLCVAISSSSDYDNDSDAIMDWTMKEDPGIGYLTLSHNGAFVAQFHVEWDEDFSFDGLDMERRIGWEGNDRDLIAPFEATIELPANANNISIIAKVATNLARQRWRKIIDVIEVPLIPTRNVEIFGPIWHPRLNVQPPL